MVVIKWTRFRETSRLLIARGYHYQMAAAVTNERLTLEPSAHNIQFVIKVLCLMSIAD